jgi:hypothetical protein
LRKLIFCFERTVDSSCILAMSFNKSFKQSVESKSKTFVVFGVNKSLTVTWEYFGKCYRLSKLAYFVIENNESKFYENTSSVSYDLENDIMCYDELLKNIVSYETVLLSEVLKMIFPCGKKPAIKFSYTAEKTTQFLYSDRDWYEDFQSVY